VTVESLARALYLEHETRGCGNARDVALATWARESPVRRQWVAMARRVLKEVASS
jgi:hypothetical protein